MQIQYLNLSKKKYKLSMTEPEISWKNHYTFYTMTGSKPIYIPKKDIVIWDDLLNELSDATNFQKNYVEVVINSQKVYYEPHTKLADIGIRKDDLCIALKRDHFKPNSKERNKYDEDVENRKQACQKELFDKLKDAGTRRLEQLIESKDEYHKLFKQFESEFQKGQIMAAIEASKGEKIKTKALLQSGQAKKIVDQKQSEREKKQLRELLQNDQLRKIKQFIQENKEKVTDRAYIGIIQKLHEQYPKFKKLQPKHQLFVKQQLMGLSQINSDEEIEQDKDHFVKKIFHIVSELEKQKKSKVLPQSEKIEYLRKQNQKGHLEQQAKLALTQAANNVEKAEELLNLGLLDRVDSMMHFVKKAARINLVLQFFARPDFETIRADLKGKKNKSIKFVEWILNKNDNNRVLSNLIAKYKDYVVTYLSGQYTLQKPEKLEQGSLELVDPLSKASEEKLRKDIQSTCNRQLVEALKVKVGHKLAEDSAKAAMNKEQYLGIYLLLEGVNQQFDFCPSDPKSEQIYLHKKLKKDKQLRRKLAQTKDELLFLNKLSVTRPKLFELIVRNKNFVDRLTKKE